MKIGIHTCCYTDNFSDDPTLDFAKVKAAGIDVVEFSILNNFSKERAMYLRKKLEENSLEGAACTAIPEDACLFSDNSQTVENAINYLKRCIDFSHIIDSKTLSGVLYSPWGKFDTSLKKREKWQESIPAIREVCDYAKQFDVTICFEVLNRFESDFLNTVDEGAEYVELVGKDNLKILADAFHMNIEEENMYQTVKRNISSIGNVHISENNRDFPKETNPRWKELITSLKEVGYEGNITFECCLNCGTEVGNAFSQWQDLLGCRNLFDTITASTEMILGFM